MISRVICPLNPAACKCKIAKNRCLNAKVHASASHTTASKQQQQQKAFLGLKACTPICLADIVEHKPGYRALVAASDIQAGDTVIEVLNCNTLCVPNDFFTESDWRRDWLKPFTTRHGRLPHALISFLLDFKVPYISRLATLVLYMKKTADHLQPSSSSFWGAWFELLPSWTAATHPGAWTAAEVRELQFQPTMALMSWVHDMQEQWCSDLVAALQQHSPPLGYLIDNDDAVRWALYIAKTRSVGSHMTSLYPVHDFLNHNLEDANLNTRPNKDRYHMVAVHDIKAGTELTISYTSPEGRCDTDLLLSWGFTTSTWRRDWALPQIFHLLPPVHCQVAVAATIAAGMEHVLQKNSKDNIAASEVAKPQYAYRLAAAVASLPLTLESLSRGESATLWGYAHAAGLLQQHNISHPIHQQQPNSRINMSQQSLEPWRQQCVCSDSDYLFAAQDAFYSNVSTLFEFVGGGTFIKPGSKSPAEQRLGIFIDYAKATTPVSQQQGDSIRLQRLSAAAVHCECQLLLLQAGTTVQQDEDLLQALEQQQQHQQQVGGLADAVIDPSSTACTGRSDSSSSSTHTARRRRRRVKADRSTLDVSVQTSPSSSSSSSNSKSASLTATPDTSDGSRGFHKDLKLFQKQQQQLVRNLMLLQALRLADGNRSNDASNDSSNGESDIAIMMMLHLSRQQR